MRTLLNKYMHQLMNFMSSLALEIGVWYILQKQY